MVQVLILLFAFFQFYSVASRDSKVQNSASSLIIVIIIIIIIIIIITYMYTLARRPGAVEYTDSTSADE